MIQSNTLLVDEFPWDQDNYVANPFKAVSPIIKFSDEPLSLSCASYRVGEETGSRWSDLEFMKPTDEDRVQAQKIRKYYMERLVLERLSKPSVSPFREKMGAFLAGNHEIRKEDLGMLYKLPYFYTEDQIVDSIMEETDNIPDADIINNVKKLKPLKRLFQSRRTGERTQFWFTTEENHPVAFTVAHNNMLFGLVESLFNFHTVTLSGKFRIQNYAGQKHNYYSIQTAHIVDLEPKHG